MPFKFDKVILIIRIELKIHFALVYKKKKFKCLAWGRISTPFYLVDILRNDSTVLQYLAKEPF